MDCLVLMISKDCEGRRFAAVSYEAFYVETNRDCLQTANDTAVSTSDNELRVHDSKGDGHLIPSSD